MENTQSIGIVRGVTCMDVTRSQPILGRRRLKGTELPDLVSERWFLFMPLVTTAAQPKSVSLL